MVDTPIDLIKSFASSHFAAGAAGGFVRSFYVREAWEVAALRTFAGGISAHYVTPLVLWFAPRLIEMSQAELLLFNGPAGAAVSFAVGLMGIFVSTSIEKVINKYFNL